MSLGTELIWQNLKKGTEDTTAFDMDSLRNELPQNRKGLSRYYSGKSRSFACMEDVHCLEDLKKPKVIPNAKRKKCSDEQPSLVTPFHCRRVSSATHCAMPCIGV
uniref:Uncharacterized protein n=1 Tax=Nelumbo nucifera TaxID=4432 RepID=A0A822XPE2_NELNU|nr:TPA_asm: hypothetical protein HUJ06_023763 [Nelumbo nucifera]